MFVGHLGAGLAVKAAEPRWNLGVLFAAVGAVGWVLVPIAKGLVYFASSPRIRSVRLRAITVTV